ncbi:MAG: sulfatase-like hydrolase/transferase, partial [Rikenellaceae bacterium]
TNAPHAPLNIPLEYCERYESTQVDGKPLGEGTRRFYGMISNIDDNFKKLEDLLKKLKIADNTILIFTTDNGTAGGKNIYNAGMSGGKGSVTEGGHRVPFFVRWKDGQIDGGRDVNNLVAHYDLLPTFVDLLGLDFEPVKPLDGKSLKPLLTEESPAWENRILYMDTQRQQNLIKYKSYVVMDDNWRLVDGTKLYNINEDLAQTTNVIDDNPEVAARLMVGYERWWDSFNAEEVDRRHAYIYVGSPKENPVRISAHDLHIGDSQSVWHQYNALSANRASGNWKIRVIETGEYKVSLCRFPRESGLAINAKVPQQEARPELQRLAPASTKDDFVEAKMHIAGITKKGKISADATEVSFTCNIPEGYFDLYAELIDSEGHIHPAYYLYIEKI